MGQNQGSIIVSQKKEPSGPPFAAASANQGLSVELVTGIIQLGNANILSALPVITAQRNIPTSGGAGSVQFNRTNIALPANTNKISDSIITMTRNLNAGGLSPQITLLNAIVAGNNTTTITEKLIQIRKGANAGIIPQFILDDTISGTSNKQFPSSIAIIGSATDVPFITITGATAGQIVISQFSNSDAGAGSSVMSKWFANNSARDFEIIKYADAAGGGTDLTHTNAAQAAPLRIISISTTPEIRMQLSGTNQYINLKTTACLMGDLNAVVNGLYIDVDITNGQIIAHYQAQQMLVLNGATRVFKMGDTSAIFNKNNISINDTSGANQWGYSNTINFTAPVGAGARTLSFGQPGTHFNLGDIDAAGNSTMIDIDDTAADKFIRVTAVNGMYINIAIPSTVSRFGVAGLPAFVNNAAAVAGGLAVGEFYRLSAAGTSTVMVVQ